MKIQLSSMLIPISFFKLSHSPRRTLEKFFPLFRHRETVTALGTFEMSTARPQKRDIQWADVFPRPTSLGIQNLLRAD